MAVRLSPLREEDHAAPADLRYFNLSNKYSLMTAARRAMADRGSVCAVLLLTSVLSAAPAAAQVADLGKYPNLKGQWLRPPGSPNNWLQLAGPPPLTPEYQKLWEESKADQKAGGPGNWPSTF